MDHGFEMGVVVVVEVRGETDLERSDVTVEQLGATRRHDLTCPLVQTGRDKGIGFPRPTRPDRGAEHVQEAPTSLVRGLRREAVLQTAVNRRCELLDEAHHRSFLLPG